jgi:hypothetical protein
MPVCFRSCPMAASRLKLIGATGPLKSIAVVGPRLRSDNLSAGYEPVRADQDTGGLHPL